MSQNKSNSIDELIRKAESCLNDEKSIAGSFSEVSFWLLERDIEIVEEHRRISDISQIKPHSKIDIELTIKLEPLMTCRFTIKTVITENGVFALRHAELTGVDIPYSMMPLSSAWGMLKKFVTENSVGLAGLALSVFNTALTVMRLGQAMPK